MHEERSIYGAELMNLAKRWIQEAAEIFVVARLSHSAGGKEYYFFNDFERYKTVVGDLPPMTDVCIFHEKQLATRAIADKNLEETIKTHWKPGQEWMIAKLVFNEPLANAIWYEDESEFEEVFEKFRNEYVAIGRLPAWWENDYAEMQSGLTPLKDGTLKRGIY